MSLAATPFDAKMLNDEESPVLDIDGRVVKASDHSGVFVAYSLLQQSDGAATQGFETRTAPSAFRAKVDKITKNRALFNSKDGDHDGKLTSKELSKILKPKGCRHFSLHTMRMETTRQVGRKL